MKISKNLSENIDGIFLLGQSFVLLAILMMIVIGISAFCYSFWESLFGNWGFHVSRDVFPVVGSILLCAIQLRDRK